AKKIAGPAPEFSENVPASANLRARFAARNKYFFFGRRERPHEVQRCIFMRCHKANFKNLPQTRGIFSPIPTAVALFRSLSEIPHIPSTVSHRRAYLSHNRSPLERNYLVSPTNFSLARMHALVQCAPSSSNRHISDHTFQPHGHI